MKTEKQIANFQKKLASHLKQKRESLGISKTELEQRTGLSRQGIRLIEEAERTPSIVTLWQISDGMGLSLIQLLDEASVAK